MNCLFVFGPSCSGKSTLTQALAEHLGASWIRLDRDDLIEQGECEEEKANERLDQKIQSIRQHLIIDAQVPWREKREGEFYFLVLPPLEVLLQRDAKRTQNLNQDTQRAQRAKNYVIKTYQRLSEMPKEQFDACLDSSTFSLQEEIETVQSFIQKGAALQEREHRRTS